MSFALLQSAMLLPLELAVNRLLALDEASTKKLAALEGGTLAVLMQRPATQLYISISGGKLRLSPHFEGEPTTTLGGPAAALAAMLFRRDAISGLHNSGLELRGNTGFAQSLQNLLLESRIDWEYQLSRVLGDIPTQLVAEGAHKSQAYLQSTVQRAKRDVGDFLQEEGRWLPATTELETFYTDVQTLVLRLDRLDARLTHLAQRKG